MHQFKKNYGQNFLKTTKFAHKLVDSLNISADDTVIEIGPGDGMVTKLALDKGCRIICIEVDYDLLPGLIRKFGENKNFNITHSDVLQVNFEEILDQFSVVSNQLSEQEAGSLKPEANSSIKVIGSLPYNISKKIIDNLINFKVTNKKYSLNECSFIVQEEVAKEYVALPPQSSFLSNYLKVYSTVRKLETIPAYQFFPMPKVNGAILNIKFNKEIPDNHREIVQFIRIGFSAPRKTLIKNLKNSNKFETEKLLLAFKELDIKETARPAELDNEQWMELILLIQGQGQGLGQVR